MSMTGSLVVAVKIVAKIGRILNVSKAGLGRLSSSLNLKKGEVIQGCKILAEIVPKVI